MSLKSIKLAGFKSFADPTTVHFPSTLTAIVGPNGCGKSNIVDALRWVIGESSAKQLRGEHLADVIFSGTSQRKPIGQASIELIFNNANGQFGGEYAQYHEIAIRREITRDGQSQFYLNNARCRRRDITDLFLGTGLGPNSYAIIEQGVVSKLVEGKPEDIRTYLEEAAGTSKYKERRRETENRLRHTRENLDRLTDLRLEMEKQLEHLKRQASAAERYKTLKQDQRLIKAQLHALHCQALNQHLAQQQQLLDENATQLEAKIADYRRLELTMEQHRLLQAKAHEDLNAVQGKYYQVGSDVARQEQQIQHIQTQTRQLADDLAQMETALEEAEQHLEEDSAQVVSLTNTLASLESETQQAVEISEQSLTVLQTAEKKRAEFQSEWESFHHAANQIQRKADVEQTRLHHLSQKIQGITERLAHLEQQRAQLNNTELPEQINELAAQSSALKEQLETLQELLAELNQRISQQQQTNRDSQIEREQQLQKLNQLLHQKASLEALQQAALGKHNQGAAKWLEAQGWADKPRLLEGLNVEKGWETAVETVLAPYLEAVCTENLADFQRVGEQFKEGRLALLHTSTSNNSAASTNSHPKLSTKIQSRWAIANLLSSIYLAEDIAAALELAPSLAAHESVITPEGFWFGSNWMRISKIQDETRGVLQRQQALQEIEGIIAAQEQQVQLQKEAYEEGQYQLVELEQERDAKQRMFREISVQHSESHARFSAQQAHLEQVRRQEISVSQDWEKLKQQQMEVEAELQIAKTASEQAQVEKQTLEANRAALVDKKQQLEEDFEQQRQRVQTDKQTADEYQVRLSSTQSQLHYLNQNIQRVQKQLTQLQERREAIFVRQESVQAPLSDLQATLQQLLEERITIEKDLSLEKQKLTHLEDEWRQYEKQRTQAEKDAQHIRDALEKIRIAQSTAQTQHQHHLSQIEEAGYELAVLLQEMPQEATDTAWQEELERIENRIQRLGAINLAAIEEYQQVSERKNYLDAQNKDLCDALQMLEEAIQKIDRESRARLRETFDKANAQFKELFGRMFEGGNAELEWVGDEVLSAGVAIRAQPPGKRNTLLHLLSGGEKALTAIALVFALFQLNPAPFCVLDEVDAPLDEANVGRFCRLVKSMSSSVQFLFISHNKTTMEMAQQMIGVTMQEPGISRLVSVDMEQAIAMAEVA